MKARQILGKADVKTVRSSTGISVIPLRFDNKKGIFEWEVHGATGLYKAMIQIEPRAWRLIGKEFKGMDLSEALEYFREVQDKLDILVHCSCPSFLYHGYAYIATKLGFAIKREGRPPRIRNPGLRGTVCKHLVVVLREMV
jgi:dihydrodipicolinate synthase/N-acetylneuraminate lyase